jgi:tRNA-specific 2-thiouridylase
VAIRPEEREVVVGGIEELAGHQVTLRELNWLAPALERGDTCEVQIRYRARAVPGTVTDCGDDFVVLALTTPVRAITPGQSGVMYGPEGRVLGGGVIE